MSGEVSTWQPVDVGAVIAGGSAPTQPTHFQREDGLFLLYPGRLHDFHGEAESMKSWAAQVVVAEVLKDDRVALVIDFESEPRDYVGRLLALGVTPEQLTENLVYVRPDEPLQDADRDRLLAIADDRMPAVTVIDGVDAAMEMDGLNPNREFRTWLHKLVRGLQKRTYGPVILVDHVAKNRETRGDYAAGDRAKRSVIDGASFGFEVQEPFGRGRTGRALIQLHKDRAGFLRGQQRSDKVIATLEMTEADGMVTWQLLEPGATPGASGAARSGVVPTDKMEAISKVLESESPLSGRGIEGKVFGGAEWTRKAISLLVEGGYVRSVAGPRRSFQYTSVKPYRVGVEGTDATASSASGSASGMGETHSSSTASQCVPVGVVDTTGRGRTDEPELLPTTTSASRDAVGAPA